jgi:hypothetical protein
MSYGMPPNLKTPARANKSSLCWCFMICRATVCGLPISRGRAQSAPRISWHANGAPLAPSIVAVGHSALMRELGVAPPQVPRAHQIRKCFRACLLIGFCDINFPRDEQPAGRRVPAGNLNVTIELLIAFTVFDQRVDLPKRYVVLGANRSDPSLWALIRNGGCVFCTSSSDSGDSC